MTPKISVIIPTYNRKHLIGYTIDNILSQSLKPFEIIVVDDHSSDNTLEWLSITYKNQLILLKSKGKGPGAARNTGLEVASGDLIQFFDSDDLMTMNKLEVQAKLLSGKKDTFVYSPYALASAPPDKLKFNNAILQYHPLPNTNLLKWVYRGWCSITQACLFPKDLIDLVGPWREDIDTHEDREYWYRIAKIISSSPIHENKSCTLYRQHDNQLTFSDERQVQRALDSLVVDNHILKNKDKIDYLSKVILKARSSFTHEYLSKHSPTNKNNQNLSYTYLNIFHRLYAKISRIRSGNDWHPMIGTEKSNKIFNSYFADLETMITIK